jgi:iron(III) transport system permease protein
VRVSLPRASVISLTALAVFLPLGLIFYQSLLDAPFFAPHRFGVGAFEFIFADGDFWDALRNSLVIAGAMALIAVPLGGILAFLMIRTDLPGRGWIEPLLLIPVFVSPMVLGFGYVVSAGPVGFYSVWAKELLGFVPWNVYSLTGIAVIAGLTHVPHVYLYSSSALKSLGSDVEEAARMTGSTPFQVARDVSLPMVTPSLLFSGVLVFFLGFEIFGLPLVLGDPEGHLVLATYLYKLTNKLGVPSYQLMAVVVVAIIAITAPLVFMQRLLLRQAQRYVSVRGKGLKTQPLRLHGWRWFAFGAIVFWLFITVVVPLFGITLRSFVVTWGEGVKLFDVLTLDHYRELTEYPNVTRGILNTLGIGVIGGAIAVACYTAIALAVHRWNSGWTRLVDYLVMVPRAMPGLVAGLALLWVFLFVPFLSPLKSTMVSIWLAYTIVWLAYGMRLVSGTLLQVGPELEEAARTAGANDLRVKRDVTIPLIKYGMLASWLLVFLIFVREYSTGIYLLGPGTEVIGSLLVSLWGTGAVDLVSALSVVNVVMIGVGLAVAVRLGVRLHG